MKKEKNKMDLKVSRANETKNDHCHCYLVNLYVGSDLTGCILIL